MNKRYGNTEIASGTSVCACKCRLFFHPPRPPSFLYTMTMSVVPQSQAVDVIESWNVRRLGTD